MKALANLVKFLILFLTFVSFAYGNESSKVINILTWWGYLNNPEIIKAAEKQCGTVISFDEYYSNDEFLRRLRVQKNSYDLLIFSNTIYDNVKGDIPNIPESKLWQQSDKFNATVKKHYFQNAYPHNIIYFAHSLTGFMYDPKSVALFPSDSIATIFEKGKNRIIVIMDDSVEAKKLLSYSLKGNLSSTDDGFTLSNFKKLSHDTKIYIGNGLDQVYSNPEFAFSFSWSGEALQKINDSKPGFKFLIHPKLSYISSDLLVQTNSDKRAECVATVLSSKEILSIIENKNYYFSSYANIDNISDSYFRSAYKEFINLLPKLSWVHSVNAAEFDVINRSWDQIKLDLANEYHSP